jgi:hypothetical protein
MKKIIINILSLFLLLTASSFAQQNPSNLGSTIKEIFIKGSIDGKHLFLVLGMEDSFKATKDMMKNVITERDIYKLSNRWEKLKNKVYNKKHDDDYVDVAKAGYENTKEEWTKAVTESWDTIKHIPQAFNVDIEKAKKSYYNSKNEIAGALKFSGLAVWAVIHGTYYLIIEAPAEFAFHFGLGALLSPVTTVAIQTIRVGFDIAFMALRSAWIGIKASGAALGALAINGYALLSTTTATTITLVSAAGLAIYKGAKFVFVELPRRINYPIAVAQNTGIEFQDESQNNEENNQQKFAHLLKESIAEVMANLPSEHPLSQLKISLQENIHEYKSKIKISYTNLLNETILLANANVGIKKKMIHVQIEMAKHPFKLLKQNKGLSRKEIKEMLESLLNEIVQKAKEKMNGNSLENQNLLGKAA